MKKPFIALLFVATSVCLLFADNDKKAVKSLQAAVVYKSQGKDYQVAVISSRFKKGDQVEGAKVKNDGTLFFAYNAPVDSSGSIIEAEKKAFWKYLSQELPELKHLRKHPLMIDVCVNNADNNAYILLADASSFHIQKKNAFSIVSIVDDKDILIPSQKIVINYSERITSLKDISISSIGGSLIAIFSSKNYGPFIVSYDLKKKNWKVLFKP